MIKNNSGISLNFEWNSLIRDIVRSFWTIILIALIALMGIDVVEKSIYTPTYTSSAVLVIRSKLGTGGVYDSFSTSAEMAEIYTSVFKQNSIKKLAAENLGLESFDGTIVTSVSDGTNLLNVSVKSENPELAFKLLKSVLEVYPEVSEAVFTNAVLDILSEPKMPTSPSNSRLTVYRKHIIVLAMLFEGGMIVLLSLFRGTVKEEKNFSNKVDAKLIGSVSHEKPHLSKEERFKRKKRAMLINDAYSSLRFTEDYQKLATKLEYMNRNHLKKSFVITSVAENEGKSTIAANLSIALSERGYNVILVDLDIHKPAIYKIFEFNDTIETDFSDMFSQKIALMDFKFYRYRKSNLVIAFNQKIHNDDSPVISSNVIKSCLEELREKADFVIFDTPPISVSADAVTMSSVTDAIFLVVRTDCVPVEDINEAILNITDGGGNLEGCILNDVYKPFTLFGQMGSDESGYHGYNNYYGYSKTGKTVSVDSAQSADGNVINDSSIKS